MIETINSDSASINHSSLNFIFLANQLASTNEVRTEFHFIILEGSAMLLESLNHHSEAVEILWQYLSSSMSVHAECGSESMEDVIDVLSVV